MFLLVSCTGTRLTARTGTGNRFSVRFFDKLKTGTRTVSNKNYMTSLNHVFNISSNCLSGNNHALSQYSPNPVNFLSIRRDYFYSNVANHSAKPPCFPFPFLLCTGNPRDVTTESVIMTECACADWPTHARSFSPVEIPCSRCLPPLENDTFTHVCDNCEITSKTRS